MRTMAFARTLAAQRFPRVVQRLRAMLLTAALLGGSLPAAAACPDFPAVATLQTGGTEPTGATVADLNNDGRPDLAVTNRASGTIAVLVGLGNSAFAEPVTYTAGTYPSGVAAGDFNRDGRLDLAVANTGSDNVSVFLASGGGTFSAAVHYAALLQPSSVATGDVNADGVLDLAVPNQKFNNVSVLLGRGDGTFAQQITYSTGGFPIDVLMRDFNGDGRADIATANYDSGTVSILIATASGFASTVNYPTGGNTISLAAGDFNGDGKLDLAAANRAAGTFSILAGTGNGAFAAAVHYGSGRYPNAIAAADFNGDGRPDLAVAKADATLSLFSGTPSGAFAPAVSYGAGLQVKTIVPADFNGDGRTDVALANRWSNDVSIVLGSGNGTLAARMNVLVDIQPYGLVATDLDGDGTTDIATSTGATDGVTVLRGAGNGSFATLGTYTVGDGPYSLSAGDFNGDGRRDLLSINGSAGTVSVLLGTGAGVFAPAVHSNAKSSPHAAAIGDFNGDGRSDVAIANNGFPGGFVSVLISNGDGTFATPVTYSAGAYPGFIVTDDFNGDGKGDLATSNETSGDLSIFLGRGDGTFATRVNYAAGTRPQALVSSDFNGDGIRDLAVANKNSHNVSVLLGTGAGSFATQTTFAAGTNPTLIVSAELNGDGRRDLVVGNATSQDLSVLLGNGSGGFAAAMRVAVGNTPYSLATGELNGDGKTDLVLIADYDAVSVLLNNPSCTFTVNDQFLTAEVRDWDSRPAAGVLCALQSEDGPLGSRYDRTTNGQGTATWWSVPDDFVTVNVFDARPNAFGVRTFWGAAETGVSPVQPTRLVIQRNQPYINDVVVRVGSASGPRIDPTISVTPGETIWIGVVVRNPTDAAKTIRTRVLVDRDRAAGYAGDQTSAARVIAARATTTFAFSFTLTAGGTYSVAELLEVQILGGYAATDGSGWRDAIRIAASSGLITSFQANPLNVQKGSSTTLTWSTAGATAVSLDHGLGAQSATGTRGVQITGDTTFTLTARGANGTEVRSVRVEVINPAPSLQQFEPASVIAGSGAITVAISGSNFMPSSYVEWDGTKRASTFVSPGLIRMPLGAADVQTAGARQVVVVTPSPGGGRSSALAFSVTSSGAPPALTFIDPACTSTLLRNFICQGENLADRNGERWPANNPETWVAASNQRKGAVTDGVAMLVIRIRTSSRTRLQLLDAAGQPATAALGALAPLAGGTPGVEVTVDPVSTTQGGFAFAVYRTPLDYPSDQLPVTTLSIRATANDGSASSTPLILSPPPVVLVHGVWSSATGAWGGENGLQKYLGDLGFPVCSECNADYGDAAGSFDPLSKDSYVIESLISAVDMARVVMRARGYSVAQVDVVAHSQGGLVTRARVKYAGKPYLHGGNYMRGDFHKVSSVGTPHHGTPIAKVLIERRCSWFIRNVFSIAKVIGPAVFEFQPGSRELQHLGSTDLRWHSIIGIAPNASDTEDNLDFILDKAGESRSLDTILGGNGAHDTIVPKQSQSGGLAGAAADDVSGIVHANAEIRTSDVSETRSSAVWRLLARTENGKVQGLLMSGATSTAFAAGLAAPPSSSEYTLACINSQQATRGVTADAVLTITPASGTTVRPGEPITIRVEVVSGSPAGVAITAPGLAVLRDAPAPFIADYVIPDSHVGPLTISASIYDAAGPAATATLNVVRATSLISLVAEPPSVYLDHPGQQLKLSVTGHFADGSVRDLGGPESGTVYTIDGDLSDIATVSANGTIQAVGSGVVSLLCENSGQTTSVSVVVDIANYAPRLDPIPSVSVPVGSTREVPLAAHDPNGDELTLRLVESPAFVTLEDRGGGRGVVRIGAAGTAGTYEVVVTASDNRQPPLADVVRFEVTILPAGSVNPSTPVSLSATGLATGGVSLTWNPVAGVDHYEVTRRSAGVPEQTIGIAASNGYLDTTTAAATAYVYRVRAISPAAEVSGYSAPDLATTVAFTDDPLTGKSTPVRIVHINELRSAINAVRSAAGLPAFSFTDPLVARITPIRAIHMQELRAALAAARAALGLPVISYTSPAGAQSPVRAADLNEIRSGVK